MRKHQWILTLDEPTFSYSSPAIGLKRVLTAVQYSTTARETPALPTIGCDELSGPEAVVTLHPAEHRRLPGIRTTLILYPETELSQQPATFVNVCAAKFQRLYILQPSAESTLVLKRGLVGLSAAKLSGIVEHLPSAATAVLPVDQSETTFARVHEWRLFGQRLPNFRRQHCGRILARR